MSNILPPLSYQKPAVLIRVLSAETVLLGCVRAAVPPVDGYISACPQSECNFQALVTTNTENKGAQSKIRVIEGGRS
jgi:hypothetical protein